MNKADQIRELNHAGYSLREIVEAVGVEHGQVWKALRASPGAYGATPEQLASVPTIGADEATFIAKTGWPHDEEATSKAIWDAAEQIRNLSPRLPVGFSYHGVVVTRSCISWGGRVSVA